MGLAAIFANRECVVEMNAYISTFNKPELPSVQWARAEVNRIIQLNAHIIRVARVDFGIVLTTD
jgi:hypothetical protein